MRQWTRGIMVDGDLPRDEDWLPSEVSVEITIQPEVDDSE